MSEKPTYKELEQRIQELESARSEYKRILEEQQLKERIYQNLFENMLHEVHVWELVCDYYGNIKTWKLLDANPTALRSWGKTLPEIVGRTANEIFNDFNATELFLPIVKKIFEEGTPHQWETYFPPTDQFLQMISIPMDKHFISAGWDISDQKKAETELRISERKYRKLYEEAAVGIFHSSLEGQFLDVNPALSRMLGYNTPQEVVNSISNIAEQIYVEPQLRDEVVAQSLAKGETVKVENRYRRKDGSEWNAYLHLRYVADSNGQPICLEGFVEDITDRKRFEEALKESKTFLENMTDVAYMADHNGNILWVNPAVERVTGLPPEEIIGNPFLPLFVEADHASLIDVYKKTLAGESLENTLTFKSGVTCHFTSLPKRNQNGDIVGTFGVARDISDRLAAERALQTSEARLKQAQTMAKVGNWEYDVATGKVWGSEEAFRIYGIERISDFLPLDEVESCIIDAKTVNQALVDLVARNKPYDIEFQIRPKNKEGLTHVHSIANLICDGEGKPKKVVGVIQEITERKQAEEILHKSNEMLKHTEAMANIGSWEWDVQHDQAHWSEELFRIFGRNPAEGAPSFAEQSKLYVNKDMQRLRDAVERCVKQGTPYEIEVGAIRTDGETRHCVSRGKAQYNENGKVSRLIGSFQDITDRKLSENQIKSLERRNQALLDHSPVCHKIVDLDFNLQYMSANGFRMLKLDENSEVYGKPYPFYFFPEAFQNEMKEKLKKVIDTGQSIAMEALTNDVQGNEVWLDSSLIPVFDDDGNIEYITVVSANVTQRKCNEKEKERLEAQLRQTQKMEAVGRLAGGVAHDINNMLSVILGNTEMAMEDLEPSHPVQENLEEINGAALRSSNVVRQLLAFARKQTIAPKVLDLNETVEEMLKMLCRLIGEDIDLSWNPGPNLWPVKIDPSQVDQILANLAVNARDAIADVGKLTIETGNVVFDEDYCRDNHGFFSGDYILLAVTDNGCGMDKETQDKVFEPFFSTKEPDKGTGLGLATVYGIVKQNNGFIKIYSELNLGTTFKIYLPRQEVSTKPEIKNEQIESRPQGSETILLVEDEPPILKMTKIMLERLGYQVFATGNPNDAIRIARNHAGEIHLLVTDVVMPEMNGRDLANNILSIHPNIKCLFMSGYTSNVIAHHGVLDEGVNFIQKPVTPQSLGNKVREAIDEIQRNDSV